MALGFYKSGVLKLQRTFLMNDIGYNLNVKLAAAYSF